MSGPDLTLVLLGLVLTWLSLGSDWPGLALAVAGLAILTLNWPSLDWPFWAGPLPSPVCSPGYAAWHVPCSVKPGQWTVPRPLMVLASPGSPWRAWLAIDLTGMAEPDPDWLRRVIFVLLWLSLTGH